MKQIIRKLGIALPLIVGAILFGCWNNGDIVSDEQDESAPRPLVANKPATLIPSARNSPIVVFTIDDGMLSTYTGGFPVFQEFGYPATAFIPTQRVMQNNPGR
jgi:peptidoglycan/xylan/chitin deacetylase (PgdA/CDA1 family)